MQHCRAVHRKIGNAFSDAVFYRSDDSDQRREKIDRMPELQGTVSGLTVEFGGARDYDWLIFQDVTRL